MDVGGGSANAGSARQTCLQLTRSARRPESKRHSFDWRCVSARATTGRTNRSASAITPRRNASGALVGSRNASLPCVFVFVFVFVPVNDASSSSAVVVAASHASAISAPSVFVFGPVVAPESFSPAVLFELLSLTHRNAHACARSCVRSVPRCMMARSFSRSPSGVFSG